MQIRKLLFSGPDNFNISIKFSTQNIPLAGWTGNVFNAEITGKHFLSGSKMKKYLQFEPILSKIVYS